MATSTGYSGKTNTRESEIVAQQATTEREAQFGEMPGEIVEFDPITQKAMVKPLYRPRHVDSNGNMSAIDLPILEEVPVRFDRCFSGGMTYPLAPGDRVLLRPIMRNTERFHTEDNFEANDTRSFSLSDMEAYMDGGEPVEVNPIPDFDDLNAHWRFNDEGEFGFRANKVGQVSIEMTGGELLQILINVLTGLAGENTLTNRPIYAAAAAQLIASKITI